MYKYEVEQYFFFLCRMRFGSKIRINIDIDMQKVSSSIRMTKIRK